ncbi:hypothetical protein MASR2M29_02680 [Spirochaetota bacterium]
MRLCSLGTAGPGPVGAFLPYEDPGEVGYCEEQAGGQVDPLQVQPARQQGSYSFTEEVDSGGS